MSVGDDNSRVDMKAVMAEAEAAGQNRLLPCQSSPQSVIWSNASTRTPQHMPEPSTPTKSSKLDTPLTWRTNVDLAGSRGNPPATPPTSSSFPSLGMPTAREGVRPPMHSSLSATRPSQVPSTSNQSVLPGMGPVITPTRQTTPGKSVTPNFKSPNAV